MKNILLPLLIVSVLSCKAQIIPIENHINYIENETEIPDGAYLKDVNNLLPKFTGTWTGNYNNKSYEFMITKYTDIFLGISKDALLLRYKITDSNGNIIEDTTNLPTSSQYVCEGRYLKPSGSYILTYVGQDAQCGQHGTIFIDVLSTSPNEMKLFLEPGRDTINPDECPNNVVHVLPTEVITLTKQ